MMTIIAIDDEKLALEGLMTEIALAAPEAEVHGFRNGATALSFCRERSSLDVAFCDIELEQMNGLTLGDELLKLFPKLNLIYTTGFSEYAVEAIGMRCSGYIMKPINAEKIRYELDHLRYPPEEKTSARLYARTFGKFEAFVDGKPLMFHYQKTKELLAFLIDRGGVMCSNAEIIGALWEDYAMESSHISYLKNIRRDLISVMEENNCVDCIVRNRGELGILKDKIDCDLYDYLDSSGIEGADRLFHGEYMSQYPWGEYRIGSILRREVDRDGE